MPIGKPSSCGTVTHKVQHKANIQCIYCGLPIVWNENVQAFLTYEEKKATPKKKGINKNVDSVSYSWIIDEAIFNTYSSNNSSSQEYF